MAKNRRLNHPAAAASIVAPTVRNNAVPTPPPYRCKSVEFVHNGQLAIGVELHESSRQRFVGRSKPIVTSPVKTITVNPDGIVIRTESGSTYALGYLDAPTVGGFFHKTDVLGQHREMTAKLEAALKDADQLREELRKSREEARLLRLKLVNVREALY